MMEKLGMANAKLQGCSAELQCLPYGNVERQCLFYGPQLMNTLLIPAKCPIRLLWIVNLWILVKGTTIRKTIKMSISARSLQSLRIRGTHPVPWKLSFLIEFSYFCKYNNLQEKSSSRFLSTWNTRNHLLSCPNVLIVPFLLEKVL